MYSDNKGQLGREGEIVVKAWLVDQGYLILPASLIDGMGAPMLEGKQRIILPDNLTWHKGTPGWIEVKTKSHCTKHEVNPQRDEHGIKLRHWMAYEMIQMQTQTPVWLAILQIDIKSVGLAPIETLKAHERIYPMQGEQHIFLDWNDFGWHLLTGIVIPEPIEPTAPRTIQQIKERAKEVAYPGARLF
jgi:hypothetical protein